MTLKLENIELNFDALCVLNKINLTVEKGEFLCLLGPSGCGKTSTLRICAGLESPNKGRVLIDDKVVTDANMTLPPEKREIGFLFQDFALFPHLSIFDNVAFGLKGQSSSHIKERVHEVLRQVQMDRFSEAMPHTLSGGQQQRVALARALAPKPRIMMLDEPFSGLDSGLRAEMRDMTLHVLKNNNITAIMVTHDPEEAMFMADRIALMRNGVIIQQGTPYELYQQPVDHFAASFFGEVNIFKGIIRDNHAVSALGSLPVTGFTENEKVDILVRPENVILQRTALTVENAPETRIEAARYLGRDTLVHLSYQEDQQPPVHFHARVSGHHAPTIGDTIIPSFDPKQAYVFRAS